MVLNESQKASLLGNGASSLLLQVKKTLVTVAIILCAVVTPCESQNDQLSCGKQQSVSLRITWGAEAQLGEFPWHAAIFSSANNNPKYICGGSIIHKSVVISSAHCFISFNRLVPENLITVHVGIVNLNEATKDQQVLNVSKIIPHPKFFPLIGIQYDIAILKLSTNIVMSPFVYPVCLWDKPGDHNELAGKIGTIVGFGFNEKDEMSSNLQKAELTVVDIYDCLDNDRETYGRVLTRNMFCAGGKANVSACNGDSGGGIFFEENDTWFIRGIISSIAMRPNATLCDTSKYTIFTDVSRFRDWVMESISEPLATKRLSHLSPCKDKIVPKNGTCNVAHLFEHSFLLVADDSKIMRVSFNGEITSLDPLFIGVKRLDHDCAKGRFYWIKYDDTMTYSARQIYSANYNGTDEKLFIEDNSINPLGLAVDWISRRLYWSDRVKNIIEVASLENPTIRTVLIYEDLVPHSIAVDPLRSKLYWKNTFDNGTIEWSNLDGSERQVLVGSPQISDAKSIKVSTSTGELCYIDQGLYEITGRIKCFDPSSKQIRTIADDLSNQEEWAITDEVFYWTNWKLKTIERINSNGVRQEPITLRGSSHFTGMSAVTDKCPLLYSPCARNNGDCPENTICLVNSGAPAGRSCIVKKNFDKSTQSTRSRLRNAR